MKALVFAALLTLSLSGYSQESVSDLQPAHAATLERYLAGNKANKFRQEFAVDEDYLANMREYLGRGFMPNYAVGDFNGDKIGDFAVLLARTAGAVVVQNETDREPSEHFPDYPLTVVIFNGIGKGKFREAFREDLMGPRAAFIKFDKDQKPGLYYAVFESDADTMIFAPAGRGYIVQFEKPR